MALPEIHFLPLKGHRARGLAVAFLVCAPFLFGALAVVLGQDANWDLRNYHFYNAYAFLNHRYDFDLLPSQTPYFYNPVLDVPFYLLATHLPAMVVGYILGFVQGLNGVLLFMLAYASLLISNPRHKVMVCAALAVLGMLGGGGIAQIGTTFYDNVTSIGMFLSALLVIRHFDALLHLSLPRAFKRTLLFGIPAGMMVGLKLPSVIFCVGLCSAFLFVTGSWQRRIGLGFAFGLGVVLGFATTYSYWGWFLQEHYGSPFFPYFNAFFKSPLAPLTSARDMEYVPANWKDRLLFPFIFMQSPYRTGEIPWRDWRIPILYGLLPVALMLRLFFGRARIQLDSVFRPVAARYLLWVAVISYATWLFMFGIYRYAIPLEMLAPLLIVFAAGLLPVRFQARGIITALILLVVAASVQHGNWTRRSVWLDHFVEAKIPPLGDTSDLMILMAGIEPYSHLVTQFPPEISFVRIQSNFSSPGDGKGINKLIEQRVCGHAGRFLILIPVWEHDLAQKPLSYFNLRLEPKTCQMVTDRLYDDKPIDLCGVIHGPPCARN